MALLAVHLTYGAWFHATYDRYDPGADLARRTRALVGVPESSPVDERSVAEALRTALVGRTPDQVESYLHAAGFGSDGLSQAGPDGAQIDYDVNTRGFAKPSYRIGFRYRDGKLVDVDVDQEVTAL